MRNIPPQLKTRIDAGSTSITELLKLTSQAGKVLAFTRHQESISIGGVTYLARPGMNLSHINAKIDMSVDNAEGGGYFYAPLITPAEVFAGSWDEATWERSMVDYEHPEYGVLILGRGLVGQITVQDRQFKAELRSLTQLLQQKTGRVTSALCDVVLLGDARCKADLTGNGPDGFAYRVSAVASGGTQYSATFPINGAPVGWFDNGLVECLSGVNQGSRMEINSSANQGSSLYVILQEPLAANIAAGDNFQLTAGCDRSFDTCKAKFSNGRHFKGTPHLIGTVEYSKYAN